MKPKRTDNDVHSRKFESKLDPMFTSKVKLVGDSGTKTRETGSIGGKRAKSFYLNFSGNSKAK